MTDQIHALWRSRYHQRRYAARLERSADQRYQQLLRLVVTCPRLRLLDDDALDQLQIAAAQLTDLRARLHAIDGGLATLVLLHSRGRTPGGYRAWAAVFLSAVAVAAVG